MCLINFSSWWHSWVNAHSLLKFNANYLVTCICICAVLTSCISSSTWQLGVYFPESIATDAELFQKFTHPGLQTMTVWLQPELVSTAYNQTEWQQSCCTLFYVNAFTRENAWLSNYTNKNTLQVIILAWVYITGHNWYMRSVICYNIDFGTSNVATGTPKPDLQFLVKFK